MAADLLELGVQPIQPDAPCGQYGRDEPEFAALQVEIRKLELPDQPTPDWDAVVHGAATLLGTKSKDLLIVVYLCLGVLERDGIAGLATGLTVLRDTLRNFWDTLYPEAKRIRGRVAAIEWLAERGSQRLARPLAQSPSAEMVAQCLERVQEIGGFLAERVEGGGSLLSELRRALEDVAAGVDQPQAAPSPTVATSGGAVSQAPSSIATAGDLDQTLTEARRLLRAAGEYLRRAEPADPLGYRLPRIAAWLAVRQLPPHVEGRTQIPSFQPPNQIEKFEQMQAAAQWPGMLQETEDRLASSVFWLDLHRYAATALERMGPDHQPAAAAVGEELAALLRRLPGLAELRFADDVPLASSETRTWIAERVLPQGSGAGAEAVRRAPAAGDVDEDFEKARGEAMVLARQKQLSQAVAILEEGARRNGSLRGQVRWKLEIARLCMDQNQHATALGQLQALDDELQSGSIEKWDPAACVEVLESLILCRQRTMKPTPEEIERSRVLMGRLCRLDVVRALELNGRK